MSTKKAKNIRSSPKFVERLRLRARNRIENQIDKEMRTDREMTEMLLNCPSFNLVEKELSTIPKKEDLI